jgi:hypothetical protein
VRPHRHLAYIDVAERLEDLVQGGGPQRLADDLGTLWRAAPEHVPVVEMAGVKVRHRLAHRIQPPEPERQPASHRFRVDVVLVLLVGRKKQFRFEIGEPRRHQQVVSRQIDLAVLRLVNIGEVLVGQLQDRDLREIDLVPPRQLQQQVERPLESVEVDAERIAGVGRVGFRLGQQVLV